MNQQYAITPQSMAELTKANEKRFVHNALKGVVEQAQWGFHHHFISSQCYNDLVETELKNRGFNVERIIGGFMVRW